MLDSYVFLIPGSICVAVGSGPFGFNPSRHNEKWTMPLSYVPPDQPTAEFYNMRSSETFRLYTSAPYPYEKTYSEIIPYASVFWIWKVGNPDSQKWMGIVWNKMYFMKRSQSA